MSRYRMQLLQEKLEIADRALQVAIGQMGRIAGGKDTPIGSVGHYRRMVSCHLKLQQIKREIAKYNKYTRIRNEAAERAK